MRIKTLEYTCQQCGHQWTDALPAEAADAPIRHGCSQCSSNDITYKPYVSEKQFDLSLGFPDATRITNRKPDQGFRDVLRKVKHAHPLSPIDPDK